MRLAMILAAGLMLVFCAVAGCQPGVTDMKMTEAAKAMGQPYYSGAILPTPQEVEYGDRTLLLLDGPAGKWTQFIPRVFDGQSGELAKRMLDRRLQQYLAQYPALGTEKPLDVSMRSNATLLDFIEKTNPQAERWIQRIRDAELKEQVKDLPPQGYVLEITPYHAICIGADAAGVMNGMASFLQLLHVDEEGRLVVQCAKITDWPTFEIRYTSEYHLPDEAFFDWMMANKINGFGACYPGMRWTGDSPEKQAGLRAIGEYIEKYGTMNFMVQYHVGGRGGCAAIDCANEDDVQTLLNTVTTTLMLSHAQHVMICYDDVTPELQPEEAKIYKNPAQAHEALMERVYERVKTISPDTIVSFCSSYYQGLGHRRWWPNSETRETALEYMSYVHDWKNTDIRIVWTGPVTESRSITQADLDAYLELIGHDKKLVYWDNTWHYHQPLRNFHAKYLDGFIDWCADATSYINVNGTKPIGEFFAVTANDYYWNPAAFDELHSRQHAVAQFMGPDAVEPAEAFYELRGNDYGVFFQRDVALEAYKAVLEDLDAVCLDRDLMQHCWNVYNATVKSREPKQ